MIAQLLAGLDRDSAASARAALDWMLPEGGTLDDLGELELLTFLTYVLPTKWLVEPREHHEVAWALGDFFAAADRPRFAAHCRSNAVHLTIDAWETDRAAARRQMRKVIEASGVDPPDSPLLTWGGVQGMAEYAVHSAVSAVLQQSIDDGSLRPGTRGWRAVALTITERALREAGPGDARSRLERVRAERRDRWIDDARRRSLPLSDDLVALLGEPDHASMARVVPTLEPVRWLLEQIGDGVRLTQAGYLPRALVLAADERYDWFDLKPRFTIRTEGDLFELTTLRELVERRRLVTKSRGRLTVSAAGRRALADDDLLAAAVLDFVFDARDWYGDAAVAIATILLSAGPEPVASAVIDLVLVEYLGTIWRLQSGGGLTDRLTVRDVLGAGATFATIGRALGWTHPPTYGDGLGPSLTDAGRAACLLGLSRQAHAPREHP